MRKWKKIVGGEEVKQESDVEMIVLDSEEEKKIVWGRWEKKSV